MIFFFFKQTQAIGKPSDSGYLFMAIYLVGF